MTRKWTAMFVPGWITCFGVTCPPACAQAAAEAPDVAAAFGALESAYSVELSPDGKRITYIGPGEGTSNIVLVVDIAASTKTPIVRADGQPMRLTHWLVLVRPPGLQRIRIGQGSAAGDPLHTSVRGGCGRKARCGTGAAG